MAQLLVGSISLSTKGSQSSVPLTNILGRSFFDTIPDYQITTANSTIVS